MKPWRPITRDALTQVKCFRRAARPQSSIASAQMRSRPTRMRLCRIRPWQSTVPAPGCPGARAPRPRAGRRDYTGSVGLNLWLRQAVPPGCSWRGRPVCPVTSCDLWVVATAACRICSAIAFTSRYRWRAVSATASSPRFRSITASASIRAPISQKAASTSTYWTVMRGRLADQSHRSCRLTPQPASGGLACARS